MKRTSMPAATSHRSPVGMLLLGALALLAGAFCAYDALQMKPTDGAVWLLGGEEMRVVGLVPGGPAEQAITEGELNPIALDDVIEGIDGTVIESPRHASHLLRQRRVGETVSYLVNRAGDVFRADLALASTRTTDVGAYLIYCGLGLIYFLVGLYVYLKNPSQVAPRLFYLLGVVFLLYFFSASGRSSDYYWSEVVVRNLGAMSSLVVPPLFLHFFMVFPRPRTMVETRRWVIPAIYLLPLLYYVGFSYGQFFGSRAAEITNGQQMVLGLYFSAGLASLVATYVKSHDHTLRQRVKFLTLGTVLGVLPYLVFSVAFEIVLGRDDFQLLGAVPLVLVPVSFGYSIARYRLAEIEVIVRRSLVFAVLTGVLVGAYLLIVIVVGNVLLEQTGQSSQLVAIIATLLIAGAFAPARERIQGFLERRFFREKYDLQAALQELALAIPRTIERKALQSLVRERVTSLLHPQSFHTLYAEDEVLRLGSLGEACDLPNVSSYVAQRRSALVVEALRSQLQIPRLPESEDEGTRRRQRLAADLDLLHEAGIEIIVPALAGERLVAAMGLGAKRSEAAYDGAELELLAIVAVQMGVQLENTRLYDVALARRKLEEELSLARSIQQRLLPSQVPSIRGYEIAAINLPSQQISGDYYDFVSLYDGRLSLVISDVSGKGMGASLLASNLQASLRALATIHSSPAAILKAVNSALYESTDADRFATLFLAALDPGTRRIMYSSAGHNPPLLLTAGGLRHWLEEGATPLGAFPGMEYPETDIELNPGDVLVMYTDGVTEAEDGAEVQFGTEGLEAVVVRNSKRSATEIASALRDAVFTHIRNGGPPGGPGEASENAGDDLTVIVLRAVSDEELAATPDRARS